MRWFSSLWKGKTFAFTMAGLTLLISLGIFFVARTAPQDTPFESKDGKD